MNRQAVAIIQALVFLLGATSSGSLLAAASFTPSAQPYGYIAPMALSAGSVDSGSTKLFRPWFDSNWLYGDLNAFSLSSAGVVAGTASWSSKTQLTSLLAQPTGWKARQLFTSSAGSAVDYACQTTNDSFKRFICGDNSNEIRNGGTYRDRLDASNLVAPLGDIIHSQPVYVGAPDKGYPFDGYLAFANSQANRAGRVYVGANDGMLHAINAATGDEVFAYIPSVFLSGTPTPLSKLAADPYIHQYYVDGQIAVADVYEDFDNDASKEWRTVLVGGLGAGGQAYFALDVTDPAAANMSAATAKFLWEKTASDYDLGYTYAKPVIARLNTGKWAAIIANGYLSNDINGESKARLYIVDIVNGSLIKAFSLGSGTSNGLSSPAVIDTNADSKADYIYAGDLDGDLWKIDISDASSANWQVFKNASNQVVPLFSANDGGSPTSYPQPITTAPDVAIHPKGGYQVFVGTGERLSNTGSLSAATHQSIYGIRDYNLSATVTRANLVSQTLSAISGYADYRTASANSIDWSSAKGWMVDLGSNEQVLQDPQVRDTRLQLMITDTTAGSEKHWLTQLDYVTGGKPETGVFDIDADGDIDEQDNPDYVDSGNTGNRVVAIGQSGDLVSRPVIARKGTYTVAYLNAWSAGIVPPGPPLPAPSCTKMDFVRFDFIDGGAPGYSMKLIAHLNDNPADDIWIAAYGLGDSSGSNPPISPSAGSAELGAGSGLTVLGDQTWSGLSMYFGEVRNDRVWLNIEYNGPYQINHFDIEFNGVTVRRIHDGIGVCGCTSSYTLCPASSDRIIYGDSHSGQAKLEFDNQDDFVFNSTLPLLGGSLKKPKPNAAVASVTAEQQSGGDLQTGRLVWRELMF